MHHGTLSRSECNTSGKDRRFEMPHTRMASQFIVERECSGSFLQRPCQEPPKTALGMCTSDGGGVKAVATSARCRSGGLCHPPTTFLPNYGAVVAGRGENAALHIYMCSPTAVRGPAATPSCRASCHPTRPAPHGTNPNPAAAAGTVAIPCPSLTTHRSLPARRCALQGQGQGQREVPAHSRRPRPGVCPGTPGSKLDAGRRTSWINAHWD